MNPGFLFLITSVLCSVTVAILLKLARRFDIDIRQAIAVNYVIAALACWLLLGANLSAVDNTGTPWGVLIALGILLPTVFVAMGQAVRHVGIVRSDAAQRLSVFIPVVAAFLFFGDTLTARKGAAIAVGLIALLCLLADTLGRSLFAPLQLPVGLVLAVVGVPIFLLLLITGKTRAG